MEIQVAKSDLMAGLSTIGSCMGSGGNDITSHYVFRVQTPEGSDSPVVEVLGSVDRMFVVCPLVARADVKEGAFTIEGWRLKKWLSAVPDAALSLNFENGVVKAVSPRGSLDFHSLNPDAFPFWDDLLVDWTKAQEAWEAYEGDRNSEGAPPKVKFVIGAPLFSLALSHAKNFVSPDETSQPHLAVTESFGKYLSATDRSAAALVSLQALDGSNIRIHGKDIPAIMNFLSQAGSEEVEILQHPKAVLIRRPNGAMIGESKFGTPFPNLQLEQGISDDPNHWWDLGVEDVLSGIKYLSAAAPVDYERVDFDENDNGDVVMWMKGLSGKRQEVVLSRSSHGSQPDAPEIPTGGFAVNSKKLVDALSVVKGDTVRFNIVIMKGAGAYLRIDEDLEGDALYSILTFKRRGK